MKETPIRYNDEMVRAIQYGRKGQTRRIVKCDFIERLATPEEWNAGRAHPNMRKYEEWGPKQGFFLFKSDTGTIFAMPCPYGKPGDRLWVRETWADVNTPDGPAICYRADGSYQSWHDFSTKFGPDYGAGPSMDYDSYPGDYTMWWEDLLSRDEHKEPGYRWRPSIHMPRWACRIILEITDIRVERLQDISEEDAKREGVKKSWHTGTGNFDDGTYLESFVDVWDSIYSKKHPWSSNPYVWVVSFELVK